MLRKKCDIIPLYIIYSPKQLKIVSVSAIIWTIIYASELQVKQEKEQFRGDWDHVVVMVGANDLGYVDEAEAVTDLHGIMAELQELNPFATVDVCEMLPRKAWTRTDVPSHKHPNDHALQYNKFLHREYPGRVIRLYNNFVSGRGEVLTHLYKKDGLHPAPKSSYIFRHAIMGHLTRRADPGYYSSEQHPKFYEVEARKKVVINPEFIPMSVDEAVPEREPVYLSAAMSTGAPLPGLL